MRRRVTWPAGSVTQLGGTAPVATLEGATEVGAVIGKVIVMAEVSDDPGAAGCGPGGMLTWARSMRGQWLPCAPVVMPVVRSVICRPDVPPALITSTSARVAGSIRMCESCTPTCSPAPLAVVVPAARPSSASTSIVSACPVALSTSSST